MSLTTFQISLSPALKQHLASFQARNQFATLDEAVLSILKDFFALEDARQFFEPELTQVVDPTATIPTVTKQTIDQASDPEAPKATVNHQALEQKMVTMTQQLIQLQKQLTDQYDQLRGQVAAIHLSHSGLIKNLRERVEDLESTSRHEPPSPQ